MNMIWGIMILAGMAYGMITGRADAVSDAVLSSAKEAVTLCITMLGVMAFWMGLMEIAQEAGIIRSLSKKLRPLIRFLFPRIPEGHPAQEHITMNCVANMLGLGWAATPAGLKAMEALAQLEEERRGAEEEERKQNRADTKRMKKNRTDAGDVKHMSAKRTDVEDVKQLSAKRVYEDNAERPRTKRMEEKNAERPRTKRMEEKNAEQVGGTDLEKEKSKQIFPAMPHGVASNEMCTFLILNISSLQLIPMNVIAYRTQYGSVNPTAIVGPGIAATLVSTLAAVVFCKVMDCRHLQKI